MNSSEELFKIADRLRAMATSAEYSTAEDSLSKLDSVSREVGRASSGSWLGYHAHVYYADLKPPPPGAHFSHEWGLKDMTHTSLGSRGDWQEYDPEELYCNLRAQAGDPDLSSVEAVSETAAGIFGDARTEIQSILLTENSDNTDAFLSQLLVDLDKLRPLSAFEIIQVLEPKGRVITRDMIATGQGKKCLPIYDSKQRLEQFDSPSKVAMRPVRFVARLHHILSEKGSALFANFGSGPKFLLGMVVRRRG